MNLRAGIILLVMVSGFLATGYAIWPDGEPSPAVDTSRECGSCDARHQRLRNITPIKSKKNNPNPFRQTKQPDKIRVK